MTSAALVADLVTDFKANGRIVIVGASLAGLRAAETLRDEGFTGKLTIIGDEKHEPYDRPPLSKQVLKGWVPAEDTLLPRPRTVDAEWRLGVAATGLDRRAKQVQLSNGEQVPYDRLLIATGVRARALVQSRGGQARRSCSPSAHPKTRNDCGRRWRPDRSRVLIIGAGFIGSEMASVCRELDLAVTVAERADGPLVGALGGVIGKIAAEMQRDAWRRPAHRRLGRGAGRRRARSRVSGQAFRRDHARRRRGHAIAWFDPQHRMVAGGGPGQRPVGRRLRRGLPRLRHPTEW